MNEGWEGAEEDSVTPNVFSWLWPQLFTALTLTVPPLLPAVASMLVPVDVPDHPEGSVHI